MSKLVHVIDDPGDLRENITELLEIEGYEVKEQSLDELMQAMNQYPKLVLFNSFSHENEVDRFIHYMKSRSTQVIVLSPYKEDYHLSEADAIVSLPFSHGELVKAVEQLFE